MGGIGSGRNGGRPTVESTLRLDIDRMMEWGAIRPGDHLGGEMTLNFYDDQIAIKFESRVGHPENSWLRLTYAITDHWTGDEHEIDDQIFLVATQPPFGGRRWWFECPRSGRRVRVLHLPLGGRHFRSRRAYRLGYASQRETVHDRALRRARKICRRLGGDLPDDEYPDKPKRMRWTTYERLMHKLVAAERGGGRATIHIAGTVDEAGMLTRRASK
jgi:hypothetical protein